MIERIDETIVAISSASGRAAVGIVRLSGPQSLGMVAALLDRGLNHDALGSPGSRRRRVELSLGAGHRLPAMIHLFRAPHSYTRQDMAEVLTIGSPPVLELVRKRCLDLGARPAEAGEFTARAFLNGAMTLTEAEAVAGIITAQSDVQLRAARRLRDGALSRAVAEVRDDLARRLALVEAGIDFADEPIEFISPDQLRRDLNDLVRRLDELVGHSTSQERLDAVPTVLLVGAPNVGKSTLMNALTGSSRAICAAVAGTTRDVLSAPLSLPTGEVLLLDSAGIDDSADEVLSLARSRTLETLGHVDLRVFVLDLTGDPPAELAARLHGEWAKDVLAVGSKLDRLDAAQRRETACRLGSMGFGKVHLVSAHSGEGLEELRGAIAERLADRTFTVRGESLVLNVRQSEAIRQARATLGRARTLAASSDANSDSAELLAFELREALDSLGTILGEVTTEDLLGEVFSRFCIGK